MGAAILDRSYRLPAIVPRHYKRRQRGGQALQCCSGDFQAPFWRKEHVMSQEVQHWPTELRVKNHGRLLRVTFEAGTSYELSAEYLRVKSPSAEVQGHPPADRKVVGGQRNATIQAVEPVGHYAVRLRFGDG